jgi:hypothetical protein
MPMKSKLQNEAELCVKYVMRELDPSEEMLVEQAMLNDENTLIEVESLRNTYRRIQVLPQFAAPESLLEKIADQAGIYQNEQSKIRPLFNFRKMSYAAAASLLIAGGASWYLQNGDPTVYMVTEDTESNVYQTSESISNPWIDNKNILHVNGGISSQEASVPDSMLQKLRPIDGEIISIRPNRQLQLTGAQN